MPIPSTDTCSECHDPQLCSEYLGSTSVKPNFKMTKIITLYKCKYSKSIYRYCGSDDIVNRNGFIITFFNRPLFHLPTNFLKSFLDCSDVSSLKNTLLYEAERTREKDKVNRHLGRDIYIQAAWTYILAATCSNAPL